MPIVITTGEPAGIGPDICLQLCARANMPDAVFLGDMDMLRQRAARLRLDVAFQDYDGLPAQKSAGMRGVLRGIHIAAKARITPGVLNPKNAEYVHAQLLMASDMALSGKAHLVTAPVHKGVMREAGFAFTGHTEFFGERAGANVIMLLSNAERNIALLTTHIPLCEVAAHITAERLDSILRLLIAELSAKFQIKRPRILVAGLNPHAGEGGTLGDEEVNVMVPVIAQLQNEGCDVHGPMSADTMFMAKADAFLCMYHDQGLPVIKTTGFRDTINITLGLPYLRTSVDHGTALALAATGKADAASLAHAYQWVKVRLGAHVRA